MEQQQSRSNFKFSVGVFNKIQPIPYRGLEAEWSDSKKKKKSEVLPTAAATATAPNKTLSKNACRPGYTCFSLNSFREKGLRAYLTKLDRRQCALTDSYDGFTFADERQNVAKSASLVTHRDLGVFLRSCRKPYHHKGRYCCV